MLTLLENSFLDVKKELFEMFLLFLFLHVLWKTDFLTSLMQISNEIVGLAG